MARSGYISFELEEKHCRDGKAERRGFQRLSITIVSLSRALIVAGVCLSASED